MKRGVFIVFEGIEGSGKSTQAELLAEALRRNNINVDLTREPGGTQAGERIREVLLDPALEDMHPRTELLLYLAARAEHVAKRIRRKLCVDKAVVISDRFTLSTLAYQAGGRELDSKTVSRLCKFASGGLEPDLTVLVDLDVEGAFARLNRPHDRLEQAGKEFHEKVREAYLYFARRAPKRIRVFDGAKEKMMLHEEIKQVVLDLLRSKGIL
ncbi:MAG: dTMP kinase [candidate division WOR-3 bacterium]|nr:dTMP kinase [candidate division WOR-3 bacterium]